MRKFVKSKEYTNIYWVKTMKIKKKIKMHNSMKTKLTGAIQ